MEPADMQANLRMFILDSLRYDIENPPSIVQLLNDRTGIGWRDMWPRDFTVEEVLPLLVDLCQEGLVEPLRENWEIAELVDASPPHSPPEAASLYYLLTQKGRRAWENWQPPEGHEQVDEA